MRLIAFNELRPEKGIVYSRDHLREKVRKGEFPAPVQLSDKRIAWIESEIDDWINQRLESRDSRPGSEHRRKAEGSGEGRA
jgi:prophage regulatory protein